MLIRNVIILNMIKMRRLMKPLKATAALVQPFNILEDPITLIPAHNSAASVGR